MSRRPSLHGKRKAAAEADQPPLQIQPAVNGSTGQSCTNNAGRNIAPDRFIRNEIIDTTAASHDGSSWIASDIAVHSETYLLLTDPSRPNYIASSRLPGVEEDWQQHPKADTKDLAIVVSTGLVAQRRRHRGNDTVAGAADETGVSYQKKPARKGRKFSGRLVKMFRCCWRPAEQ